MGIDDDDDDDDDEDGDLLGEKFEGGDFMDDRSLEEMKAPSRLIEPTKGLYGL